MTGLNLLKSQAKPHDRFSKKSPFEFRHVASSLALATILITGCQSDKSDIEYMASALAYQQKGDHQSSVIEAKNALQVNPRNIDARVFLARHYINKQLGAEAEKELQKAIESGADVQKLALLLGYAYYYQFKFDDLLRSTLIMESLTSAEQSEAFLLRGISNTLQKNYSDAAIDFGMSYNTLPDSESAKLSKIYTQILDKNLETALSELNPFIENYPSNAEAYILRAKLLTGDPHKNLNQSIEDYTKAIELRPNMLQLYIDKAQRQGMNKDFKNADKTIDVILKNAPNHLKSNLLKASIRFELNDFEASSRYAEKALVISEVNPDAKLLAGMSHFHLKNYELARKHLSSVKGRLPDNHMAHRMLAYSEFKLGYVDQANETITAISSYQPGDAKFLSQIGSELSSKGDLHGAQEWLEKAISISPDDATLLGKIGYLKLQQGDESGITDLKEYLKHSSDTTEVRSLLINFYLRQGKPKEALAIAEENIKENPDSLDAQTMLALAHLASNNDDQAKRILSSILQKDRDNIPALMTRVKLNIKEDQFFDAYAGLAQVIRINSMHEQALIQLFGVARKIDKQTDALKILINSSETNPEVHRLKVIESLAYISLQQQDSALTVLETVPDSSDAFAQAQSLIGHLHMSNKKYNQAITAYKKWVNKAPTSDEANLSLMKAFKDSGDLKAALKVAQDAIELDKANTRLKVAEVQILFESNQPNQALQKSQSILSKQPEVAALHLIQGQYYMSVQNYRKAQSEYSFLHKKSPSTRSMILLANSNMKLNDQASAQKLASSWVKQNPADTAARMFLASINTKNDKAEAISEYRQVIKTTPNNFIALNNLAWALGEIGEIEEAVKHAGKAQSLRPDIPQIADTYGYLLYRSGDFIKAEELLSKAFNHLPQDPSVAYHYALSLVAVNKTSEAKDILASLQHHDFDESQDAQNLYQEISK